MAILGPPVGEIYADHARTLITAARRAGLGYLQHAVVITGTTQPDAADQATSGAAAPPPETVPLRHEHLDLLVLVLRTEVTR